MSQLGRAQKAALAIVAKGSTWARQAFPREAPRALTGPVYQEFGNGARYRSAGVLSPVDTVTVSNALSGRRSPMGDEPSNRGPDGALYRGDLGATWAIARPMTSGNIRPREQEQRRISRS